MLKFFVWFLIIFIIFVVIFAKSGVMEIKREMRLDNADIGSEKLVTSYEWHWENLPKFFKGLYAKMKEKLTIKKQMYFD